MKSVAVLVDKGWITPDQGKFYESTVEEGVSFRTMAMGELGKIAGELYLREEEAQFRILNRIRVSLDSVSVPEVLVLVDSTESWHQEHFSEKSTRGRFSQEAAEPWHPSLLEGFRPDPAVIAYFRAHHEFYRFSPAILKEAYVV